LPHPRRADDQRREGIDVEATVSETSAGGAGPALGP